jgi:hypothetical protein
LTETPVSSSASVAPGPCAWDQLCREQEKVSGTEKLFLPKRFLTPFLLRQIVDFEPEFPSGERERGRVVSAALAITLD